MELSKYVDEKENNWENIENEKSKEFLDYLNSLIDIDLYSKTKYNTPEEIYNSLKCWLFNFYHDEFILSLKHIGLDEEYIKRSLIYSLILTETRNSKNKDMIYQVLKNSGYVYKILTNDDEFLMNSILGDIKFYRADKHLDNDTNSFINNLGDSYLEECHMISLYLLKKLPNVYSVTGILEKGLYGKYYHSFIIIGDNVLDLTGNLIMKKEDYYKLNNVKEISVLSLEDYNMLNEESAQYDKSKTLYDLLRIGAYNETKRSMSK